jgi:hypothetical protein
VDFLSWLRLLGGLIGLGLAVFGIVILVTGKAPRRTMAAYRSSREAGLYALCFGAALMLLFAGGELADRDRDVIGLVALGLALTLLGVSIALFRPRRQ